MRQAIISAARPALRSSILSQGRGFAVSALRMAEGDIGGVRSGGQASGYALTIITSLTSTDKYSDAFSKREKANEDFAIQTREREK